MPEIPAITNNSTTTTKNINNNIANKQITGEDIAIFIIGSYLNGTDKKEETEINSQELNQDDTNLLDGFLDCLCTATSEIIVEESENYFKKLFKDLFEKN